jgi:hypothetical protein
VINQAGKAPEGVPVAAKELLHLGTRADVDQTLSRLVRRGGLIRVGRGLYVSSGHGALWCSTFGAREKLTTFAKQKLTTHPASQPMNKDARNPEASLPDLPPVVLPGSASGRPPASL